MIPLPTPLLLADNENLLWLFPALIALVFAILTFVFTEVDAETGKDAGREFIIFYLAFPLLSFIFWAIFTGMSLQISNCSSIFGTPACFTNIQQTTTTSSVYGFNFSLDLGLGGLALSIFMLLITGERMFVFVTSALRRGAKYQKGTQ
jgi:hypothetical protein